MPANKNAFTRYAIIDRLLRDRMNNYSLDDLTERVNAALSELEGKDDGITRRTIEKDIYYLEYNSPFDVDIERYTVPYFDFNKERAVNKYCLRYEDPTFSIFTSKLNDDEKYILKQILSLVGTFDGLPEFEGLEDLRARLELIGDDNGEHLINLSKNPLGDSSIFGELFTHISNKSVIQLCYHTFSDDAQKNIKVYPYQLKEYNRRWYLLAASTRDGKLLNFALDRIDSVLPISGKYKEYSGDINEMFEDIIGVTYIEKNPVQTILFWVSDKSKDYVKTKPIHESQRYFKFDEEYRRQYPNLKSGAFFSIECRENYELIRELTSFGDDVIVLSPENITNKIQHRLKSMLEKYEFLRK